MLGLVEESLREALAPVLRDLARTGLGAPRFEDPTSDSEHAEAMMRAADGSGRGVSVRRSAALAVRVADAADQVQEWAIEFQLWGSAPTNWPQCPSHPDSHPMRAVVLGETAVWACPDSDSVTVRIGG